MLTKKEQTTFEEIFETVSSLEENSDFLSELADELFEMTGNVNLAMRLKNLAENKDG